MKHPLHPHPLTLFPFFHYLETSCYACKRVCNGFVYICLACWFILDVSCSLISYILTHHGHEHPLLLSSIESEQNCSCCDSKIYPIFCCTTCEFALDFKCVTLPQSTNNMSMSIPLLFVILLKMILVNIIVKSVKKNVTQSIGSTIVQIAIILYIPNVFLGKIQISSHTYDGHLFGGVNTFDCHSHTLTFIEEIINYPRCNKCNSSCKMLIYQCA